MPSLVWRNTGECKENAGECKGNAGECKGNAETRLIFMHSILLLGDETSSNRMMLSFYEGTCGQA